VEAWNIQCLSPGLVGMRFEDVVVYVDGLGAGDTFNSVAYDRCLTSAEEPVDTQRQEAGSSPPLTGRRIAV
jgi:hypothetical protein